MQRCRGLITTVMVDIIVIIEITTKITGCTVRDDNNRIYLISYVNGSKHVRSLRHDIECSWTLLDTLFRRK